MPITIRENHLTPGYLEYIGEILNSPNTPTLDELIAGIIDNSMTCVYVGNDEEPDGYTVPPEVISCAENEEHESPLKGIALKYTEDLNY